MRALRDNSPPPPPIARLATIIAEGDRPSDGNSVILHREQERNIMVKGIVTTVVGGLALALALRMRGITQDGESVEVGDPEDTSGSVPRFAVAEKPVRLEVHVRLSYDGRGVGRVQDEVVLRIGGVAQAVTTTRRQPAAIAAFHLPSAGRYAFTVRLRTWFNDHGGFGHSIPCFHDARSQGEITLTSDHALEVYSDFDRTGGYRVRLR
jgi:hypothetical protein